MAWATMMAIAPSVAQAYTARFAIALDREPGESYGILIRRAEAAARTAVQRAFDSDILVTDVSVTLIGQSQGLAAPLMTVEATRAQWRSRPDAQRWATYFSTARTLLQLDDGTTASQPAAPAPVVTPAPAAGVAPASPVAPASSGAPVSPGSPAQGPASPQAIPGRTPQPQINLPAAPAGQLGLPRSILE